MGSLGGGGAGGRNPGSSDGGGDGDGDNSGDAVSGDTDGVVVELQPCFAPSDSSSSIWVASCAPALQAKSKNPMANKEELSMDASEAIRTLLRSNKVFAHHVRFNLWN